MNKIFDKLIRYREAWFFTGLLLWAAIAYTLELSSHSWVVLFRSVAVFGIVLVPPIVFALWKERIKQTLGSRQ
jgi:hypothetical protein